MSSYFITPFWRQLGGRVELVEWREIVFGIRAGCRSFKQLVQDIGESTLLLYQLPVPRFLRHFPWLTGLFEQLGLSIHLCLHRPNQSQLCEQVLGSWLWVSLGRLSLAILAITGLRIGGFSADCLQNMVELTHGLLLPFDGF